MKPLGLSRVAVMYEATCKEPRVKRMRAVAAESYGRIVLASERQGNCMTVSTLKIGSREYVLLARRDFDRLRRKAALLSDQDAADVAESLRRLHNPKEKRIPWSRVKRRSGLE
jgi:hypothetical protein